MIALLYSDNPTICGLVQAAVAHDGTKDVSLLVSSSAEESEQICSFTDVHLLLCYFPTQHNSGMTFAERARQQNPNMKILAISDTAELDYALSAIRLRCLDYLYGPFSEKQFISSVSAVILECRVALWKEQVSTYMENHYAPDRNKHAEETLRDMFAESCDLSTFHRRLADLRQWVPQMNLSGTYYMVIVYLPPLQSKIPPWDIDSLRFALRSEAERCFLKEERDLPLLLQRHSIYLFPSGSIPGTEIQKRLAQFNSDCKEQFGLDMAVLYDGPDPFDLLKQISIRLERELRQRLSNTANGSIAERITHLVEESTELLTISTLSQKLYLSPSYLSRMFQAERGEHLSDYLRRIRLNRICSELLYSNKSISQIALDTGFTNFSNFTSYFKKAIGCTPTTYRKQNQALNVSADECLKI